MSENVEGELTKSFSSAADAASQYPHYSSQIIAAAKASFLHGDQWAYTAGIVAVIAGAVVVRVFFPDLKGEKELLASYQRTDSARPDMSPPAEPAAPP